MSEPARITGPPLPDIVLRARDYARAGLEAAVDRLQPDLARICRYYFGWADVEGTPTNSRGSRCLQASMVLVAAEATGTDPGAAVAGAVAMELLHNYTLLHDDIIDGDTIRRERPTGWVAYGVGPALLAGDALYAEAFRTLLGGARPDTAATAATVLAESLARLTVDWSSEPVFDRADPATIDIADYLRMCEGKGGALLGCGAILGTVLCGGTPADGRALLQAAHYAGTGWQAMNDLENIWGDASLVGKPGFSDLRAHKNTLPVIAAMRSGHAATAELSTLLTREELDEADLHQAAELIDAAGGRTFTESVAHEYRDRALATLDEARLSERVHRDAADLLDFTVTRKPRVPAVVAGTDGTNS